MDDLADPPPHPIAGRVDALADRIVGKAEQQVEHDTRIGAVAQILVWSVVAKEESEGTRVGVCGACVRNEVSEQTRGTVVLSQPILCSFQIRRVWIAGKGGFDRFQPRNSIDDVEPWIGFGRDLADNGVGETLILSHVAQGLVGGE